MTAADLRQLLKVRYPATSHALVFEVRNAAGFNASNSCDALALGTWPSRGLLLSGFEIKASRSDWLKELRQPHKAEAFVRFCDEWWIVAADQEIVKLDELPPNWGLLYVSKNGLRVGRAAPKLPASALDRTFVAALVKKAAQQSLAAVEAETIRAEERVKAQAAAQALYESMPGDSRRLLAGREDSIRQLTYVRDAVNRVLADIKKHT